MAKESRKNKSKSIETSSESLGQQSSNSSSYALSFFYFFGVVINFFMELLTRPLPPSFGSTDPATSEPENVAHYFDCTIQETKFSSITIDSTNLSADVWEPIFRAGPHNVSCTFFGYNDSIHFRTSIERTVTPVHNSRSFIHLSSRTDCPPPSPSPCPSPSPSLYPIAAIDSEAPQQAQMSSSNALKLRQFKQLIKLANLAILSGIPSTSVPLLELAIKELDSMIEGNELQQARPEESPSYKISETLSGAMSVMYSPRKMDMPCENYPIVKTQDVQRANKEVVGTLVKAIVGEISNHMSFFFPVGAHISPTFTDLDSYSMRSPTMRPKAPPVD